MILLGNAFCYGQKNAGEEKDLYLQSLWNTIDFAPPNEEPVRSDTMLVICTIRTFDPSSKQPFRNEIDSLQTIRYLLVTRSMGRWRLYLMPSLQRAASYLNPEKNLVLYVEGMGKTFTVNLYRAAGLSLQYNVNTIVLDYPSVHPGRSLVHNFKTAKRNSTNAYHAYSVFLKTIQENKNGKEKWIYGRQTTLFHHSLGNRMLEKAMEANSLSEIEPSLVDRLILNAPCVDQNQHAKWISNINFANQIVVHYNVKDMQLYWASVLTFHKQLGRKAKKPYAAKVQYVHFNEVAGRQHNLFLSRPGGPGIPKPAYAYYKMIFHNPEIDWKNTSLFGVQKKKPGISLKP